ncbi:MAG: hypothetical protein EZS28_034150 [Streblomastix strix]|uniref:Protein kinase domain-containing protein n=1 Tax=Streblomastix strix TaxID=222440 RepID=A0A5J4UJD6_9EUKA|nr:MAG: hypothetical protein EZS28_034150 [Streblomastix strix]
MMEDIFEFLARANGYKLLYEIGQGSSAKVWLAHCISLNQDFAIKFIDLEKQLGRSTLKKSLFSHRRNTKTSRIS